MLAIVAHELDAVDWSSLGVAPGESASDVPAALLDLLEARSPSAIDSAYWRIDGCVVNQGQLYEAAVPLIPALFASAASDVPTPVLVRILDLLVEINSGESAVLESPEHGPTLGQRARQRSQSGVWFAHRLVSHSDAEVRARALSIVFAIDGDRTRVALLLQAVAGDSHPDVRSAAAGLTRWFELDGGPK